MFTPNHWHQTLVCYQATCIRYPNKYVSKLTKEVSLSFITWNSRHIWFTNWRKLLWQYHHHKKNCL